MTTYFTRKIVLCKATNKIKHAYPERAEMHIRQLEIRAEKTGTKQGGMTVYRCKHCGQYHVGHKEYNKQYTTIK